MIRYPPTRKPLLIKDLVIGTMIEPAPIGTENREGGRVGQSHYPVQYPFNYPIHRYNIVRYPIPLNNSPTYEPSSTIVPLVKSFTGIHLAIRGFGGIMTGCDNFTRLFFPYLAFLKTGLYHSSMTNLTDQQWKRCQRRAVLGTIAFALALVVSLVTFFSLALYALIGVSQ